MSSKTIARPITVACLLAVAATIAQAAGSARRGQATPRVQLVGEPLLIADEGRYNAFADAVSLKNGEVLVVYNTGTNHKDPAMRVQLRRSKDRGRTWGPPQTVVPPIDEGYGVRDPHIVKLADSRLLLTYFTHPGGTDLSRIQTWVIASKDRGATWSDPVEADAPNLKFTANSGRIAQVGRNTLLLLLPVYGLHECGVMRSQDRGRTWPHYTPIARDKTFQGFEAEIARFKDKTLVCLMRRTHFPRGLRSVSTDGGKTWSEPEPVPVGHAPGLLVDGDLLLVNHRADFRQLAKPGYRLKGTVLSLSLDRGQSFVGTVALDRRGKGSDRAYGGIVKLGRRAPAPYFTAYYSQPQDYPSIRHRPHRVCCIYGCFFRVVP